MVNCQSFTSYRLGVAAEVIVAAQFAGEAGVALNTPILWEKAGRLVPVHHDPLNGYRYCSIEQVQQVRTTRFCRRN